MRPWVTAKFRMVSSKAFLEAPLSVRCQGCDLLVLRPSWYQRTQCPIPIEVAHWRINMRDIVGLSWGISWTRGSSFPNTTSHAFGTCLVPLGSGWSTRFHVKIQRQRRMFSSGIWCLRIFATVSVASQLLISFILACWNIFLSCSSSWDIFTSLLCFLAAETRKVLSWGSSSWRHLLMSCWLIPTSNRHTCSSLQWKH